MDVHASTVGTLRASLAWSPAFGGASSDASTAQPAQDRTCGLGRKELATPQHNAVLFSRHASI